MSSKFSLLPVIAFSIALSACGGGGSENNTLLADPVNTTSELVDSSANLAISDEPRESPVFADSVRFRVTLENFWGVEDFPQGFPDGAHLSLLGGATHNAAVSFWEPGEVASRGIEDVAEAGLIDILLFDEVAPAIENGTADSMIEVREFTDAMIDGVPGIQIFDISMNVNWPLVSMVTMLGPSPDWIVGVSGLSLRENGQWMTELVVDLPLYDGGTKSDIVPVMGGPDIIPAEPIGLVAYDAATGVYLPTQTPQNLARLTFELLPAAGS